MYQVSPNLKVSILPFATDFKNLRISGKLSFHVHINCTPRKVNSKPGIPLSSWRYLSKINKIIT